MKGLRGSKRSQAGGAGALLRGLCCAAALGLFPSSFAEAQELRAASPGEVGVSASTRFAVRKLGDAGVSAYRAGDYASASEKLEKAYELMPVPSLALWSARALVQRGLWTQAAERYFSARRLELGPGDPDIQRQARDVAAAERAALMPRIPSLRVRLEGASPRELDVAIDDSPLPAPLVGEDWPVNPGTHVVVGRRGSERVEATSSVAEGEHGEVVLQFVALPTPATLPTPAALPLPAAAPLAPVPVSVAAGASLEAAPSQAAALEVNDVDHERRASLWRSVGWVSSSVGGAALLASGVAAMVADQRHDRWTERGDCVGTVCVEARDGDVKAYNRLVDVSTAGWIGGAALLGGGILLVLSFPAARGPVDVALGPTSARVVGHF